MSGIVKNERDFWAGLLYIGIGAAALYVARDYSVGSSVRMGPGYFPRILGGLLALLGAAAVVRSLVKPGEPVGAIAWKAAAMICGATVLFGVLLNGAGLIPALLSLILLSATASSKFRWSGRALLAMAALVAFCAAVFVGGLSLPMPLVGTWFRH